MLKSFKYFLIVLNLCLINQNGAAQVARYSDINNIGWVSLNLGIKLNKRFDIAADCQIRRDDFGLKAQQQQYRAGINYNFNKKTSVLVGYSFIETFPYGDMNYPISPSMVSFPEHRIYEQLVIKDQVGIVELTHRYRLEQRWVASQTEAYSHHIDEWRHTNRFRYNLKFQLPLQGKTIDEKEWYFAGYDEIFFSFGSQVRYNLFDQNRSALLLGYKFSKSFRIEAGPFAQIVQFGSLKNVPDHAPNKTIMQYNLGYIVNAYLNLDWSKKTE
jgi:hypothetical protein